jgi:hypothetical protein
MVDLTECQWRALRKEMKEGPSPEMQERLKQAKVIASQIKKR